MGKRQKLVVELEMKYNLNPNNKQAEMMGQWEKNIRKYNNE